MPAPALQVPALEEVSTLTPYPTTRGPQACYCIITALVHGEMLLAYIDYVGDVATVWVARLQSRTV